MHKELRNDHFDSFFLFLFFHGEMIRKKKEHIIQI